MKNEEIEEIFIKVKEIPIIEIFKDYGFNPIQSGLNYKMNSPFRATSSGTSFTISTTLNIFNDWTMPGYAGDSIKFISLLKNLTYFESCFELALKYGIITTEVFNSVIYKKQRPRDIVIFEKKFNTMKEIKNEIAPPEVLDKVFRIFISLAPLSTKDLDYLQNERHLNKEEIEYFQLFTFPSRFIKKKFFAKIEEEFGDLEVLKTIPGFYKEKESKDLTFIKMSGIGIPIKNEKGQIVGIQTRKSEMKEGDNTRYVWFSSSFAQTEEKMFGTSSGSPISVIYPKELKFRGIIITEGVFKAIQLSKTYNCICISLQGISTWKKQVLQTIKYIVEAYKNPFCIYTAFDADLCKNYGVYYHLKNMTDELKINLKKDLSKYYLNEIPIKYLYWDMSLGKGADDVLLAYDKTHLTPISKEHFDNSYNNLINEIKKNDERIINDNDINKYLTEDELQKYFNDFFRL